MHATSPRLLALVLALPLASCTTPSGFTTSDVAGIEEQARRWADAVVAGDLDAITAVYEEDAVLLPDGAAPLVGRAAIAAHFASLPDVRGVKLNLVEINGHGPLAYVLGTYRMKVAQPGSDEPAVRFGRFAEVWRRHGGHWMIARDLFHTLGGEPPELVLEALDDGSATHRASGDANADGDAP